MPSQPEVQVLEFLSEFLTPKLEETGKIKHSATSQKIIYI